VNLSGLAIFENLYFTRLYGNAVKVLWDI